MVLETPFDTDLGLDVRGEMHDLFADGVKDWAKPMLARWSEALADPDDKDIVLLAMAIAAWEAGRVDPAIHTRALALLDDASAVSKRLRRAPPKPKAFKKRATHTTTLERGDLVALPLSTGQWCLAVVWDHHQDKGGRFPIADVIDWIGAAKPTAAPKKPSARGCWYASEPHWRANAICISGLRTSRHVVAKNVARPNGDGLGPAIGLYVFLRLGELEAYLLNRMRLGDSSAP